MCGAAGALNITDPRGAPAPRDDGAAESPAWKLALGGCCPRCGNATLFAGWIKFAASCRACGLDFSAFNVGDGPAAFLTLIIGALVTAAAIALELTVHPPWWVHVLLWLPITSAAVVAFLRVAKATLLVLEYRREAREAGTP